MLTIKEILEATQGELIRGRLTKRVAGVSIDSRTIKPQQLFIAIKGNRFDGHSFIAQAARKDAGAILFSGAAECKGANSLTLIRVTNTYLALADLAHYYRRLLKIPVIAITGSNGKTTTKEMLSKILSHKFSVLRNPGTENNLIGVSLSLLAVRKRHNLVVIEIGANHFGEIDKLSWIIQPTCGIITNIGPSHLEFFKTVQGVYKAKLEMVKHLSVGAKLIINKDDRFLGRLNGVRLQTITFGFNQTNDFWGKLIEQTRNKTVFLLNSRQRITLKALGRHNVYNALAAAACARSFGVSFRAIKAALVHFKPVALRMQIRQFNRVKIIVDCYNANPQSLNCALDFLQRFPTDGRKIAVCGDMLELGQRAEKLHFDIGRKIAKAKLDILLTVGPLASKIASGADWAGMSKGAIRTFSDSSAAAECLRGLVSKGDTVLIKGSRAMKMEKLTECFTNSSIR